jgi:hypothetical protein
MNSFAARVILFQVSLPAFLDLSPEMRVEKFGSLIGEWKIVSIKYLLDDLANLRNCPVFVSCFCPGFGEQSA